MRQLLTAPQVATALGYKHKWFARNRKRLEADHGFPAAVDGCGLRWDPAAIEDWLDARRKQTKVAAEAAAEDILIARARAMATGSQGLGAHDVTAA
jgi:predicted DNA-binding transcriptional regulator AlpA